MWKVNSPRLQGRQRHGRLDRGERLSLGRQGALVEVVTHVVWSVEVHVVTCHVGPADRHTARRTDEAVLTTLPHGTHRTGKRPHPTVGRTPSPLVQDSSESGTCETNDVRPPKHGERSSGRRNDIEVESQCTRHICVPRTTTTSVAKLSRLPKW